MAKTGKILFLIILSGFLFSACDDADPSEDFPNSIGIQGQVRVQNQFQQPLYEERDGISVLLEVGFRSFDLDADNTGDYRINSAPVGTYTATYSKPGYGTIIQRGLRVSTVNPEFQVVDGAQVLPTVTLTKKPTTQFDDLNLDLTYDVVNETDTLYELTLSATIVPAPPPTGQAKGYRVFLGTDPLLSPQQYLYQEHFTTTTASFIHVFNSAFFDTTNVHSGDMLYALIYGDANFDLELSDGEGSLLFPNISEEPSELISVALP